MGQDLKGWVGHIGLIRLAELGADLIGARGCLVAGKGLVGEVAPLPCQVLSKSCCFKTC